jgi:hypothetical protein
MTNENPGQGSQGTPGNPRMPNPLGLPPGSVRALVALTVVTV